MCVPKHYTFIFVIMIDFLLNENSLSIFMSYRSLKLYHRRDHNIFSMKCHSSSLIDVGDDGVVRTHILISPS